MPTTLTHETEARLASVEPIFTALKADVLLAMKVLDTSDTRAAHVRLGHIVEAISDAIEELR